MSKDDTEVRAAYVKRIRVAERQGRQRQVEAGWYVQNDGLIVT